MVDNSGRVIYSVLVRWCRNEICTGIRSISGPTIFITHVHNIGKNIRAGIHRAIVDIAEKISLRKTKRPFPDSSLAARARRALLNEGFPGKPYVA